MNRLRISMTLSIADWISFKRKSKANDHHKFTKDSKFVRFFFFETVSREKKMLRFMERDIYFYGDKSENGANFKWRRRAVQINVF
jgi:hypothetical protein